MAVLVKEILEVEQDANPAGYLQVEQDADPAGHLQVEQDANPAGYLQVEQDADPAGYLQVEQDANPAGLLLFSSIGMLLYLSRSALTHVPCQSDQSFTKPAFTGLSIT